ncbi:GNAT family N-acetyltransferase [Oricola thermophila]|uniref:GNAT family N-acetyltransferase n=1 Tax=Oricola thermophila TaxID=2742145 RepID=A0A6N1VCU5_9HYPH|nr:GNAT family N-acetyltransferase [Oricola thermophila]QKV17395.1 GNAT family N-acetyltransferase [Oricola thermophila]
MGDVTIEAGTGTALNETLEALLNSHAEDAGLPFVVDNFYWKATESSGDVIGGLSAKTMLGWLYVELLALAPNARGSGVGAKLLERAEAHARDLGLAGVYLDTYEFQAPGFYAKCGYTEIGRLPAADGAPQRIWYAKPLA